MIQTPRKHPGIVGFPNPIVEDGGERCLEGRKELIHCGGIAGRRRRPPFSALVNN